MTGHDLESDTAELVEQLQRLYRLSEANARLIVSDPEFAAMARSIIEGRLASEAALQRMDEAVRRLHEALGYHAARR